MDLEVSVISAKLTFQPAEKFFSSLNKSHLTETSTGGGLSSRAHQ